MQRLLFQLLLVLSTGLFSLCVHAEYVVIVHPEVSASLSQDDVERIFLAKTKTFPDGKQAVPVNQQEGTDIRATFDQKINGKTESQMKSYWARLIFTGKAVPIRQLEDDEQVRNFVATTPGAIGYIDSGNVDDSVKAVFSF